MYAHATNGNGDGLRCYSRSLEIHTKHCLEFIDLTESIQQLVLDSGIREGMLNIQTKHTTTAVMINENEPLLLEDMRRTLERLAPQELSYQHDDFDIRTVNLDPEEEKNGHSHCKAMFLHASETVNLNDGRMQIGKWQRIFLIELDRSRKRNVSLFILGV